MDPEAIPDDHETDEILLKGKSSLEGFSFKPHREESEGLQGAGNGWLEEGKALRDCCMSAVSIAFTD